MVRPQLERAKSRILPQAVAFREKMNDNLNNCVYSFPYSIAAGYWPVGQTGQSSPSCGFHDPTAMPTGHNAKSRTHMGMQCNPGSMDKVHNCLGLKLRSFLRTI